MGTASSAELALQAEVRQLRERIAELESERQSAHHQAEEQHRKLVAALQEEKDRLSAVIASISDEVWFADANKQFTWANPSAVREFHLAGGDEIGVENLAATLEVYRPDGSPRPIEDAPALRALKGETIRNEEEIIRTPGSGQLRNRLVSSAPVKDASGNTIGSVSVVRDITARKRAEEALKKEHEWLRVTLNSIGDAVLATDGAGKITFLNPVAARLTGWNEAEALGRRAQDVFRVINEQTHEMGEDIIGRVVKENIVVALANHSALVTRSGGEIPIEDTAAPIRDIAGDVIGVVLVFHDVTAKRRSQAALEAAHADAVNEKNRLNALMEALPVGVALLDSQGGTIASNRQFESVWGGPRPQTHSVADYAAYRAWWTATGQPVKPEEWASARAVQHGEAVVNQEMQIQRFDSARAFVLNSAAPIHDAQGQIAGSAVAIMDVTELKRAEAALRESEEKYRELFESIDQGFCTIEVLFDENEKPIDYRFLMVNPAFERQTGIPNAAGRRMREIAPLHEEHWFQLYGRIALTGESMRFENPATQLNRYYDVLAWRVGAPAERKVAILFNDISDRRRDEKALRDSEARFRQLFESMSEAYCVIEMIFDDSGKPVDFRYVQTNPVFDRHATRPMLGKRIKEIVPNLEQFWLDNYGQVALTGKPVQLEHIVAGLEDQWFRTSAFRVGGEGSREVAVLFENITERKQVERALRESEERFRVAQELSPDGFLIFRPLRDQSGAVVDFLWIYENEAAARLNDTDPKEVCGKRVSEVLPHHDESPFGKAYKQVAETGEVRVVEEAFYDQDTFRQRRWFRVAAVPTPGGDVAVLVQNLTDRKNAESALRQSEERLRLAQEAAGIGAFEWNIQTGLNTWTPKLEQMYGLEIGSFGKTQTAWENLVHPEDRAGAVERIKEAFDTGEPGEAEFRVVWPDGSIHWLTGRWQVFKDASGAPLRLTGVNIDITQRKQAEERLRHAQKLESLGLLAGGVAHDFNNLLVGVIGNASLAQEMLPPEHPAAELMQTVVKTGEQAAHLTRQMLAYSGKGKFVVEPLEISALVRDIVELVRPSIPKKVALHLELENDLPSIEADRGQVQQIVMNFAINAAEAIGSHDGLITVRTRTQLVDDDYLRRHPEAADLQPGLYVVLEVCDTGCGMDGAVKAKIFDPFFSTKFTGRGLGLAAVAGIVRGHKGAIVVTSAPGKGSTFAVLFPPAAHKAKESADAAPSAVAQGSGVVLVIDDEQVVRDMAKKALERHGYTVLVADGGLAAIDILKRHPDNIDLAVLDLSMPGMSGEETLPELRKIRPEMKVFVSSGYSETEAMTMFRGQRVHGFVQKPYTSAVLAEKVKRALLKV